MAKLQIAADRGEANLLRDNDNEFIGSQAQYITPTIEFDVHGRSQLIADLAEAATRTLEKNCYSE